MLVSKAEVMINRDSWGRLYSVVRGEILGFTEDKLLVLVDFDSRTVATEVGIR